MSEGKQLRARRKRIAAHIENQAGLPVGSVSLGALMEASYPKYWWCEPKVFKSLPD